MADENHVERAGWAVPNWNHWRDEHPETQPDLTNADLSSGLHAKRRLAGCKLAGADFRRSNMREVDLQGSDLTGADLSKCDLRGANLEGCDLSGAQLAKATLSGANLKGANLTDADLEKAQLDGADLAAAILGGAKLMKTDLAAAIGLTQTQIDGAQGDSTTDLPPGLTRPTAWPDEATSGDA